MHIRFGKALALMLTATQVLAGSAGSIGPTYPIVEEDAMVAMQKKLKRMEATGELAKLQKESQDRIIRNIEQPAPVAGITETRVRTVRYFDPTMTFPQPVTDNSGRVIVAAGTKLNPLEHVSLSKRLVFFDARDKVQAARVKQMVAKEGAKVKPILIAGSFMQTMREWGVQVYFDQHGQLSRRFGISHAPTIISQDGKRLKIEEVPSEELK